MSSLAIGLEICLAEPPAELAGGMRFALLANLASLDDRGRYGWDLLAARFPGQLVSLLSPQHGLWGEQQANMIESPHEVHPRLGIPIHSLYSETRRPTSAMLDGVDLLVIDLQDVGTRVYTFLWTIVECLKACAERRMPVLILDRPNPIGGTIEGPLLGRPFRTFVGNGEFPMRHGLTLGEAARLVVRDDAIPVDLRVIVMRGWSRNQCWPELDRAWVAPSPNLPKWESVLCYPGQVLLEGTNLSEGRGTTSPFELIGAPFLDPWRLADEINGAGLGGVTVRPIRFVPMFSKWHGERCEGLHLRIADARRFRPYRTTVAMLDAIRASVGDSLRWNDPPYEYESALMPIDILSGGDALRTWIDAGHEGRADLDDIVRVDEHGWRAHVRDIMLY